MKRIKDVKTETFWAGSNLVTCDCGLEFDGRAKDSAYQIRKHVLSTGHIVRRESNRVTHYFLEKN